MLQSMGSQRVGHDLATEQQHSYTRKCLLSIPTTGSLALSLSLSLTHQMTGEPSMCKVGEHDLKLKAQYYMCLDVWENLEWFKFPYSAPEDGVPQQQLHSLRVRGTGPFTSDEWVPDCPWNYSNRPITSSHQEPRVIHSLVIAKLASASLWLTTLFQSTPPTPPGGPAWQGVLLSWAGSPCDS